MLVSIALMFSLRAAGRLSFAGLSLHAARRAAPLAFFWWLYVCLYCSYKRVVVQDCGARCRFEAVCLKLRLTCAARVMAHVLAPAGEAVVGQHPLLAPGGEEFTYRSCTHQQHDKGTMEGDFRCGSMPFTTRPPPTTTTTHSPSSLLS